MSGKLLLLSAAIVFLGTSGTVAASDTDSCHDLYDIYMSCFNQGQTISKIKCKALADELWKHFLDKASNTKEEQISAVIADICEDGCLDAVENGDSLSIYSFRQRYCK